MPDRARPTLQERCAAVHPQQAVRQATLKANLRLGAAVVVAVEVGEAEEEVAELQGHSPLRHQLQEQYRPQEQYLPQDAVPPLRQPPHQVEPDEAAAGCVAEQRCRDCRSSSRPMTASPHMT